MHFGLPSKSTRAGRKQHAINKEKGNEESTCLKVTTDDKQINFQMLCMFDLLDAVINIVQFAMATPFDSDLCV